MEKRRKEKRGETLDTKEIRVQTVGKPRRCEFVGDIPI